jgi:hypothetical protein
MIQTTLGALVQAEPAIATIAAMLLSAKSAYHVAKLARLVATETRHFHTSRDAIIQELGTARDGGGAELKPDAEAWPAFVARVTELAAVEVTLPWGPITLAMLGDAPVSAQVLVALGPLLAEPDAEATP